MSSLNQLIDDCNIRIQGFQGPFDVAQGRELVERVKGRTHGAQRREQRELKENVKL